MSWFGRGRPARPRRARGRPSPRFAAELVADLGQPGGARRLGDPATVVLAACHPGHASPAHPGPVEMLETAAGWTLSGTRWAVLNPTMADTTRLLLPLSIDDGRLSLALVPASRPGVSLRPLGQAGQGTAPVPHEVLLRKVLVQPQDLIGAAGAAGAEYAGAVARARLTLAAPLVGVGQGALRVAAERAADRRQFGRPIAANQSVGHALASAYIEVEAAWLLIRRIVDDVRAEGWSPRVRAESAGATALAASVAGSATRLAVHVHGASGLVSTAPVAALPASRPGRTGRSRHDRRTAPGGRHPGGTRRQRPCPDRRRLEGRSGRSTSGSTKRRIRTGLPVGRASGTAYPQRHRALRRAEAGHVSPSQRQRQPARAGIAPARRRPRRPGGGMPGTLRRTGGGGPRGPEGGRGLRAARYRPPAGPTGRHGR